MPPKRSTRSLEAKLSRLAELREAPETAELHGELAKHLTDKSAHVVARAASVIETRRIEALAEDVEGQFDRFTVDPIKLDKGCIAKTAIVACLASLEHASAGLFLKGLRHIQLEPSFGGPVDTAVELRCQSAFGLPSTGYPDTVLELTTALADDAYPVRQAAVRALSSFGRIEVEPLLRLKALHGDPELQVLSETLEALLVLSPERSLAFVERYLDASDDAVAEARGARARCVPLRGRLRASHVAARSQLHPVVLDAHGASCDRHAAPRRRDRVLDECRYRRAASARRGCASRARHPPL